MIGKEKGCWTCGIVFRPKRCDASTCSPTCRQFQWRARKKTAAELHGSIVHRYPLPAHVEKGSWTAKLFYRIERIDPADRKEPVRPPQEQEKAKDPPKKARKDAIKNKKAKKPSRKVDRPSKR